MLTGISDGILLDDLFPDAMMQKDMIGTLKGHDPKTDEDFILGIFGRWDPVFEPITPFAISMWNMYQPGKIPDLYIAVFAELETDEPIVEPVFEGPGLREKKSDDSSSPDVTVTIKKVSFMNTRLDSDVIRVITEKKTEV